jgi:alkanesulfonate monooxygenase SsuD/methylene tetrahydromethanopterin reductase-like flavin-dependent oxidoreductase (luciferase family)
MRLGSVVIPRRLSETDKRPILQHLTEIARNVESLGFHGLWVTDAFARGWPTLDPLVLLGALAPVTSTIELGTCVVQIPLRHPVEHAHRIQSVNLLSNGRLRLGVGTGSTRADFDAVQADYDKRFKTLPVSLDIMRRTWNEEPVFGPAISVWPGTEGGPPVLLGAWRSERWITLAARNCQGWIASGIHGSWEDIETGLRMYRAAGGQRAVIANIFTDLRPEGQRGPTHDHAKINLYCSPAEARDRLQRLAALGLDDALLVCPDGDPRQLEAIRALL